MDPNLVGILLSGVVGAVVGAGITAISGFFAARYVFDKQEEAAERRALAEKQNVVQNVVTLLRLEIDHNLTRVRALFDRSTYSLEGDPDEVEFQKRTRFFSEPPLNWGRLMFESQASQMSTALSSEVLRRVYELYGELDDLTQLQALLRSQAPDNIVARYDNWKAVSRDRRDPTLFDELTRFNKDTTVMWNRAYGIMNTILSGGNPISEISVLDEKQPPQVTESTEKQS